MKPGLSSETFPDSQAAVFVSATTRPTPHEIVSWDARCFDNEKAAAPHAIVGGCLWFIVTQLGERGDEFYHCPVGRGEAAIIETICGSVYSLTVTVDLIASFAARRRLRKRIMPNCAPPIEIPIRPLTTPGGAGVGASVPVCRLQTCVPFCALVTVPEAKPNPTELIWLVLFNPANPETVRLTPLLMMACVAFPKTG